MVRTLDYSEIVVQVAAMRREKLVWTRLDPPTKKKIKKGWEMGVASGSVWSLPLSKTLKLFN